MPFLELQYKYDELYLQKIDLARRKTSQREKYII